jgi:hypothetical protein
MSPSVDLRLASMIRAVGDVILPALAQDGFATEQAKLLLGHLHILRAQIDDAPAFERLELAAARQLAGRVLEQVSGGSETTAAAAALTEARDQPAADPRAVRTVRAAINGAIEGLIEAAAIDGNAASRAAIMRIVVRAEAEAADRGRAWFAASGFEGAGVVLPAIPEMLAAFERDCADA